MTGYRNTYQPPPSDDQARTLIETAITCESSGKYHKAVQEYISVAEKFPDSRYTKDAIRKIVLLNTHPDNKNADMKTAIQWLKRYLTLPLTHEEKEGEELRLALLEQTTRLQTKLSRITAEKINLKTVKYKQSGKLAEAEQHVKELETKLARARIQLEEMKEVDLRMHSRRVNGSGNTVITNSENNTELYPEAYSQKTRNSNIPENHEMFALPYNIKQDGLSAQEIKQTISPATGTKHETTAQPFFPYTVQVGSFPCKETSVFEATKSRRYGDNGFTSKATIPGKGTWYRVFIGVYQTMEEARKTAINLKTHDYPDAFAVKLPYAIRIEGVEPDGHQKTAAQNLRSKGFLAYHVSDVNYDKNEILIGAYKTAAESEQYANALKKEGIPATVIKR